MAAPAVSAPSVVATAPLCGTGAHSVNRTPRSTWPAHCIPDTTSQELAAARWHLQRLYRPLHPLPGVLRPRGVPFPPAPLWAHVAARMATAVPAQGIRSWGCPQTSLGLPSGSPGQRSGGYWGAQVIRYESIRFGSGRRGRPSPGAREGRFLGSRHSHSARPCHVAWAGRVFAGVHRWIGAPGASTRAGAAHGVGADVPRGLPATPGAHRAGAGLAGWDSDARGAVRRSWPARATQAGRVAGLGTEPSEPNRTKRTKTEPDQPDRIATAGALLPAVPGGSVSRSWLPPADGLISSRGRSRPGCRTATPAPNRGRQRAAHSQAGPAHGRPRRPG